MIIRSKAPLRLGLAGGGTDVSPYSDEFGGAILNVTINMYAYATIEPLPTGSGITLHAVDRGEELHFATTTRRLPIDGQLDLLKGVYNRIVQDYHPQPLDFKLSTYVDAPPGSGLGTSSTLVVAILGAFVEWFNLPLGEYDIAHLAYEIERVDLAMAGGKQDQYAATFGGFNFMEFYKDDKVIVNPLRVREKYINELAFNLVLYHTKTSRLSSRIIEAQAKNVKEKKEKPIEAMHKLKEQAIMMKEAILQGKLDRIGEILDFGWQFKKQMAAGISNEQIDALYRAGLENGATGGKISGAGGGGFMILYCPKNNRYKVADAIQAAPFKGQVKRYAFTSEGLTSWKIS